MYSTYNFIITLFCKLLKLNGHASHFIVKAYFRCSLKYLCLLFTAKEKNGYLQGIQQIFFSRMC